MLNAPLPLVLPSDDMLVWRSRSTPSSGCSAGADARRSCSDENVVALMSGAAPDPAPPCAEPCRDESDRRRNVRRGWRSELWRLSTDDDPLADDDDEVLLE